MDNPRAIIFANGPIEDQAAILNLVLQPGDFIISADGGIRHLDALGLTPAVIIGDLDSISPDRLEALREDGVRIERFPTHKDETDLELALHQAIAWGYTHILIAGALGDRIDHTLGNLLLLTDPAFSEVDLRLDDGIREVFIITHSSEIHGQPGDIVSLLPLNGEAQGVLTDSLEYPLRQETLHPYRTRGISNVMLEHTARVSLSHGVLVCIHYRVRPADSIP